MKMMIIKPWEPGEPRKAYMRPRYDFLHTLATDAKYFHDDFLCTKNFIFKLQNQ